MRAPDSRAIRNKYFGYGVREVVVATNARIALDDCALRMLFSEHKIPRLHCRILGVRVSDEQQVDRLVDDGVRSDYYHGTISRERCVESGECSAGRGRKLSEVALKELAVGRNFGGQVHDRQSIRQLRLRFA